MLQINGTLFFQIINFLLLMWILNRLLFRPFLRVAEEREEKTQGARARADDLAVKAEALKGHYESGMSEAASQGVSYKDAQIREGRSVSEGIVHEAEITRSGHIESARRELEARVSAVRKELIALSISFSREMTGKILGRDI